jgi:hypothetical protein
MNSSNHKKSFGYDLTKGKFIQPPKIALFLGHLGLGDQIWLSGAVRYIAKNYDYLEVICKTRNLSILRMLYSDTPTIKIIDMGLGTYSYSVYPTETQKGELQISLDKYVHVYECGYYKHTALDFNENDIPGAFYDDLGIHRSVRYTHFSIPPIPQSKSLYESIKTQPYIFVQTASSEDVTSIISWDINDVLTIDPNINQYSPNHRWYALADTFVNKSFLYYVDTIKHATELHLVNSSFYTLASQISPLDAKVKLCYDRKTGSIISNYDFT